MQGTPAQGSAAELRLLVEATVDYAIFMLDPSGHVTTWNEGARRIKGYEPDEILGEHFSRFYTEEDLARDHPAFELEVAAREGRYEEEGWRLRKDGTRIWVSVVITALRDADGVLVGFGKVTRDLTQRRAAEEQLRHLRLAVTAIRDYAIFLLDPSGRIASWNEGARRLKGYEADEILGEHFSRFYTEEDLARDHPAFELEVAARDGTYEEEGWRVRKDGARFWANVVITALRDEDDHGRLIGYAKVTRDLTERRIAEQDLRRTADDLSRSNAELERFASAAAHDLVEPLHTMVGLAEFVRVRYADQLGAAGLEPLEHMTATAARLRERIDALLGYARASRADLRHERVELDAALDAVCAALAGPVEQRGATIERDGELGAVHADSRLLEVVLQNLVANALKFDDGDAPRIRVSARAEGAQRRIAVTDDGIGVAAQDRERIFDIFTRTHGDERAGSGIGLALCRQVVERHGGTIGVEPAPGGGSTFWFTLPAG